MFMLVRHAACELMDSHLVGRKLDVRLTDEGLWQARALGQRLAKERIAVVQCSPRKRARQTAALIAEQSGAVVEVHDALDELDAGEWSGQTFAQLTLDPRWQLWNSNRLLQRAPNGEDMLTAQTRMVQHLHETRRWYADHTVVIVSHAEMIRCALLYYLGLPLSAYDRLEISPAAITSLSLTDHNSKLISMNERVAA